jgi:hypothetical protein
MTEQGYRLFYRIAKSNPPSVVDLQSAKARGAPMPQDSDRRAVWDGLSVYSTIRQARRKRRTSPILGSYIVVLRVPIDGSVRIERTLRDPGHHTIWAEVAVVRTWVVSVEPA